MNSNIDRIQYLTRKAQLGVITPEERDELAHLLGQEPQQFKDPANLDILIGIALIAIIAALLIKILCQKQETSMLTN